MEPTRDELLARIKELERERDHYKENLAAELRKENIAFTQEEIDHLAKYKMKFEYIIRGIKEKQKRLKEEKSR
jgi:hypothetical protein